MKSCQICQKFSKKVVKRKKLRGHFNPVKSYFQKPNLQYLKIGKKRILVCKDCRKKILREEIKV